MTPLSRLLWFAAGLLLATSAGAVSVVDDLGRTVSLDHPARRIVTLSPHATEIVVAAGLRDQLVAIAAGSLADADLAHLPRIGGPGTIDREALLELQPDLLIGWHSGNRPSDLAWIDRSGIALYRSEPTHLQQIPDSIRAIGVLGRTTASAEQAAASVETGLLTDCGQLQPIAAYVEVWDRPAMSLGGRHWINAALRASGFRNQLAQVPSGVFPIASEAVYALREYPRISLIRRFDDSAEDRLAATLSIPGPRLVSALQILCEQRRKLESAER